MVSVSFISLISVSFKPSCPLRVLDLIFKSCFRNFSLSLDGVVSGLNSKTWPSIAVYIRRCQGGGAGKSTNFCGHNESCVVLYHWIPWPRGSLGVRSSPIAVALDLACVLVVVSRKRRVLCGNKARIRLLSFAGCTTAECPKSPHRSFVETFVSWGVVAQPVATPHARRSESAPL